MGTKTEKLHGVSRQNLFHVAPHVLEIEVGHNTRTDFGDLDGLAASIAQNGVREPLHIRRDGDRLIVVAGERRLRAVLLAQNGGAKIESIPCMLEGRYANEQDHAFLMLLENSWRKDLAPLEEAEGFKRLLNWGWDEKKIAAKFGCADTHVKNRLLLLSASPNARKALKDGEVSMASILELLRRFPDKRDEQDAALNDAVNAGTNGRATTETVRAAAASRGKKPEPRRRTLKYKAVDAHQRAVKKYLKESDRKLGKEQKNYYEGLLLGLRVAMGAEELPEALTQKMPRNDAESG